MVDVFFREEVEMLARSVGCRLMRTSVKDDVNVNSVFRYLAARCLAELREQEEEYTMSGGGLHPFTISEYFSFGKDLPSSKVAQPEG